MGGTSGSLYSIFVSGLAKSLRQQTEEGVTTANTAVWAKGAEDALTTLYRCEFIEVLEALGED
jgi:hypothetical protein